jgi:Cof subfamily protein (haloacid dehalogenase superfamily)
MNNVAAKIRLIVFDVDGTLIDDNKDLSLKTISVLHDLQLQGVAVSFATGKTFPSVEELVKALNIKVPIILSNGALIQRPNCEMVFSEFLSSDVVRELLEASESCGADLVVYTPDHIFAKEETPNTDQMKINYKEGIEAIGTWAFIREHFSIICKVIFVNRLDIPLINRLKADLRTKLEGRVAFSTPTQNSIEIMPFGVSKKTGLIHLAEALHISVEEVMVFGDQMNDLDILEHAGIGVAVDNAVNEVKAIADYVVGSNNEDGPAVFLEEYFKLK